jgi:hypothetical protein
MIVVMEWMETLPKLHFSLKFAFWIGLLSASISAQSLAKPIDVVFLTPKGTRFLKTWSEDQIASLCTKKSSVISSQKLLFEESTRSLDLEEIASIDLVTIFTETKAVRVPRFLIWLDLFEFKWNLKTKELSSYLKNTSRMGKDRIILPNWYFELEQIRKIELSDHRVNYPNTMLKIRTNPAASRGEKVFTQNCMACHSVSTYGSPVLSPTSLNQARLAAFSQIHKKWPELKLNPYIERGLIEYSEALAFEKNEVKSRK